MSRINRKKPLSNDELHRILEEDDFTDISEQFDDSDGDPIYEQSDSEGSSNSDNVEIPKKKQKLIQEPMPGPSSNSIEIIEAGKFLGIFKVSIDYSFLRVSEETDSSGENLEEISADFILTNNRIQWNEACISENLNTFAFTENPEFNPEEIAKLQGREPVDFYLLFIDDFIQDILVEETNKYAEQKVVEAIIDESITKHSLLNIWKPTSKGELLRFLALIIWMGLDKKPELRDYWSTKNILYVNEVSKICGISRNRFELLLHFFHISDNQLAPANDRLYKITPLVDVLNSKFQKMCVPQLSLCIDETMIPFRGRLSFLQYIPGKRHKYGIKIFKLCVTGGYTFATKIYGGKEQPTKKSLASRVVMELMQPLLNTGRTLYTDNFYTSVPLAHELNMNKTHLVGTLRSNRKHNPKAVVDTKLKRGEMKILQSNTKVIVGKWKDKRDVLFLTTKEVPKMIEIQTKRGPVAKPSTIVDYNSAKSFIDVSDQKAAYSSPVRRSIKWYRKIAVELLTNTAMVNALVVYSHVTGNKMSVTKFREKVVTSLLQAQNNVSNNLQEPPRHTLGEKEKRGRCSVCYKTYAEREGRASAMKNTKRVNSFCAACPNINFMCIKCFFSNHVSFLKK